MDSEEESDRTECGASREISLVLHGRLLRVARGPARRGGPIRLRFRADQSLGHEAEGPAYPSARSAVLPQTGSNGPWACLPPTEPGSRSSRSRSPSPGQVNPASPSMSTSGGSRAPCASSASTSSGATTQARTSGSSSHATAPSSSAAPCGRGLSPGPSLASVPTGQCWCSRACTRTSLSKSPSASASQSRCAPSHAARSAARPYPRACPGGPKVG